LLIAMVSCSWLPLRKRHDRDPLRLRVDRTGVDRDGDDLVDGHRRGLGDRLVTLQAREIDDLLDQVRQPVALLEHPAGEPLDRLRVVGGVVHGLAEQLDGADRGLQLVAHVGDEVTPDGVDAALARAVLDQCQHQPGAKGRYARSHMARGRARRTQLELGFADLAVPADLGDQLGELRVGERVAVDQTEGVRRGRGLEHDVVLVDDDRAGAEHREYGGDAGRHRGRGGGRCATLDAVAEVPREHPATADGKARESSKHRLERRIHAPIVRPPSPAVGRPDARCGKFRRVFTQRPLPDTWPR
jgi:hypothetical protein